MAALCLAGAVATFAAKRDGQIEAALASLAVVACVTLVGGLALQSRGAVAWSLFILMLEYVLSLAARNGPIDALAPVFAVLLFTTAELAFRSISAANALTAHRRPRRQLASGAMLSVLAAAIGYIVLSFSAVLVPSSSLLMAIGVVAAVAAVALPAVLAIRSIRGLTSG